MLSGKDLKMMHDFPFLFFQVQRIYRSQYLNLLKKQKAIMTVDFLLLSEVGNWT